MEAQRSTVEEVMGIFASRGLLLAICLACFGAQAATAQSVGITGSYARALDVTYLRQTGWEGKLDVYYRTDVSKPNATIIFFHGGSAAVEGGKTYATLDLLRYFAWGVNVVNVEWAVPGGTLWPIAAQNARCAVRWVAANASKFKIDERRLVTTGGSSGGSLALMAAMMTPLGRDLCPQPEDVKVAAVVNWSGATDFADLLVQPSAQSWAPDWFQGLPNPLEVAKAVSPLAFVRPGGPPVISIHGDADNVSPYSQAVRLHQALRQAQVPEQLITVPGGGHGGVWEEQWIAVKAALTKLGVF
jgi:acetyl esterase/lipase